MIVEVRYRDALPPWKNNVYAFAAPEGTELGEQFIDYGHPREPIVEVVALGSSYAGPLRSLTRLNTPKQEGGADGAT